MLVYCSFRCMPRAGRASRTRVAGSRDQDRRNGVDAVIFMRREVWSADFFRALIFSLKHRYKRHCAQSPYSISQRLGLFSPRSSPSSSPHQRNDLTCQAASLHICAYVCVYTCSIDRVCPPSIPGSLSSPSFNPLLSSS